MILLCLKWLWRGRRKPRLRPTRPMATPNPRQAPAARIEINQDGLIQLVRNGAPQ